ncbi:MAG: DNA polymerase III [Treponema sp.]|nr:DNA polymerase III [Treponema sp.]
MYENLLGQPAKISLTSDLLKGRFPGSVLFSGNDASGKLTAALETARILSCHEAVPRSFECTCPSCLRHKSLLSTNVVLCGPRDCFLEINAASDTFLRAYERHETFLDATRYLFLRSVRKLTMRFSDVLLEDDKNVNKIGAAVGNVNEMLETLDFPRPLPELEELTKLCTKIKEAALKLESDFLYDTIPVSQIRSMEKWARIKNDEGKKTVIIENADRMNESVRNALLKILEEPPSDTVFILLTSKRNAVMPTILSRVRTYNFMERQMHHQKDVITAVFHNPGFEGSLNDFLMNFLPTSPAVLKGNAKLFLQSVLQAQSPDMAGLIKECGGFNPRICLKIFLSALSENLRPLLYTQGGSEILSQVSQKTLECWNYVTSYNQNPQSALENLFRELLKLNMTNGNIFRCADL